MNISDVTFDVFREALVSLIDKRIEEKSLKDVEHVYDGVVVEPDETDIGNEVSIVVDIGFMRLRNPTNKSGEALTVGDKVRIYVNGWFAGAKTPKEFGEKAKIAAGRGVTAMKWDPFGKSYLEISNKDLNTALECIAAVRDAVGKDVDLLIEGHGRFNVPTSIKIAKELEQFKPMFFEEPTPPDNLEALKAVRDKSPVAISAGERLYTLKSYKDLFEMRAADYIQPDISHAGGIMELKKIAAVAEAYYIPFAPHNPSGPVANAATLNLAACCPNFSILEIMYSDVQWRKDVTDESLEYKDGYITIPDKPGLGIEINEEECLKHPYQSHTLRHYTGALTDIRPAKTEFYF